MKFFKKQQGFTLIEVLAATIIAALVSILIIGILVNSSNTNIKQIKANKNLTDASYILKVITKDIRKTTRVDQVDNTFTFTNESSSAGPFIYTFDKASHTLYRNNEVLAVGLKKFVIPNTSTVSVPIEIETESQQSISTTLYFRSDN